MSGYVPGFQPKDGECIKLNTNENPYPPSPKVAEAVRAELDRLRLYPDPTADAARARVAKLAGVKIDNVLIGNGSDELLTMAVRAFVDPGETVSFPWPTYSLYDVLVDLQGGVNRPVPYGDDWSLPEDLFGNDSPLTFLANPNSPTGTTVPEAEVARLAEGLAGVLLVDEAYVDFADGACLSLARSHANVIVTRTLSKSYSLAGLRFGYAVASAPIIAGLMKVKDSYNMSRLAIAGGAAALGDAAHMRANAEKIKATRARLAETLTSLGFDVLPSQANFLFARPPAKIAAKEYFEALWTRRILVRWLEGERVRDRVRISIGTDREIDRLLDATREILEGDDRDEPHR
jgi:histidinol-phosphate aminotransferase